MRKNKTQSLAEVRISRRLQAIDKLFQVDTKRTVDLEKAISDRSLISSSFSLIQNNNKRVQNHTNFSQKRKAAQEQVNNKHLYWGKYTSIDRSHSIDPKVCLPSKARERMRKLRAHESQLQTKTADTTKEYRAELPLIKIPNIVIDDSESLQDEETVHCDNEDYEERAVLQGKLFSAHFQKVAREQSKIMHKKNLREIYKKDNLELPAI